MACGRDAGRFGRSIGRILIEVVCALSKDTQRKMTAVKIFMADTSSVPANVARFDLLPQCKAGRNVVTKRSITKLRFFIEIAVS